MIAREGMLLFVVAITAMVCVWVGAVAVNSRILFCAAIVLTILTSGVAFFFRSPQRKVPELNSQDILSAADGRIISIGAATESEFLKRETVCVSIFLSLIDVHVNRIPVSGVVRYKRCLEGTFVPAFRDNAGKSNKCVAIGIECDDGFCMTVVQVTGVLARRITCNLDVGQHVNQGDRYGMIFLGSRVDMFLPSESRINVRVGDRVYGGVTVIGQKGKSNDKNEIRRS